MSRTTRSGGIYQRMVASLREPDRSNGREQMLKDLYSKYTLDLRRES